MTPGADGKGPYMMNDKIDVGRGRLWFISSVSELDIANTAYAAGRASRDGLREALEEIFKGENLSYEQLDMLVACAIAKDDANG